MGLLRILHLSERVIALLHVAAHSFQNTVLFWVLERGAKVVALAHALFFVASDAGYWTRGHVFNSEKVVHHFPFRQRCLAGDAQIQVKLLVEVPVTTMSAHFGLLLG